MIQLLILFVIHPSVFHSVSVGQALLLMANGALLVVAIMFYLYALVDEEASYVAPFFQLIPVFGFIFGYMVLGEVLRGSQLAAGGLIVLGGIVHSSRLF
jgi:drug/metabolite transporter (DMT)-like permease